MNNKKRIVFFSSGFGTNPYRQASHYSNIKISDENGNIFFRKKHINLINSEFETFYFDDSESIIKSDIAGPIDVNKLKIKLKKFLEENQRGEKEIILLGVSRGASALFITLSELNKENYELLNIIDKVILESPFTRFSDLMTNTSWLIYFEIKLLYLFRNLLFFDSKQKGPIDFFEDYPTFVKTLVIGSEKDDVIDYKLIKKLFDKLNERCDPNIDLLTLKNSNHRNYWSKDRIDYQKGLDSFLKD